MARIERNPFKPGAGHSPPHLAGRDKEKATFRKYLEQDLILQNVVLTGLRGVGKTVLKDDVYKPEAIKAGWVWVGSDFSEAAFVDEESLCRRILTDVSWFTSTLSMTFEQSSMGIVPQPTEQVMDYAFLLDAFDRQPGLNADKLKATLELVWKAVEDTGKRGVVLAYDEAQVVQDRKDKDQYPLAMLLETFQSIQRKGCRLLLLLTGLPTLFPRLVESRTYAERMFAVQEIGRLDVDACKDAITKPLVNASIRFTPDSVRQIVTVSNCYPYFIQFICKEAFDFFKSHTDIGKTQPAVPIDTLINKLDAEFFSGRWARIPDRQRELMLCIATLDNSGGEFTVSQIVESSVRVARDYKQKPFKAGDVSNMLPRLTDAGLVYKNRYGKYQLAVPLFDGFIRRQYSKPKRKTPSLWNEPE